MNNFVSTDWLADHLDDPSVQVVDVSWHMPTSGRKGADEFVAGHIPGGIFFDIDTVADTSLGLPHMLPDEKTFGDMAGALGISSDTTIVVYEQSGLFSAPRGWWTFATMGAKAVKLLEGGAAKWRAEGQPIETGPSRATPRRFDARLHTGAIASFDAVLKASREGRQILDARSAARFTGEAPEPRAGLASGHIPNSRNLPFDALIADGMFKSETELETAIRAAGIDPTKPVITSCGSGVTASVLALALDTIGAKDVAVYDGSWSEWGGREDAPVETGSSSA